MIGSHETTMPDAADVTAMTTMYAVRAHTHGGPEVLVYEEAPIPPLEPGDVLVRVGAAGITPTELTWNIWGAPDGTDRLPLIPGHDVAGVVAAVAPDVTEVTVGAAVFALTAFNRDGTAAEYVAVRAADLAPKPQSLTFAQAAAVPLSALTAWQALFPHGKLRAGQRVLIHGAAGGVGTFAIQLARMCEAYVIGTASARDHAFLRELGCDEVIDYTTTRFEDVVRNVDLVLDAVGDDAATRSRTVLRTGGTFVTIAAPLPPGWAAGREIHGVFFVVEPDRAELVQLARLIDDGVIIPIIEAVLPLSDARAAYERGLHDHPRGKLVLNVSEKP